MSLTRDIQKKITLAIYDHQCMCKKMEQMWHSLKDVEKILDGFGKNCSGKNCHEKNAHEKNCRGQNGGHGGCVWRGPEKRGRRT